MSQPQIKKMILCAKVADRLNLTFCNEQDKIVFEYSGYVPEFFPESEETWNNFDYVVFEIDIENGMILNWKKPSESELDELEKDVRN